MARIGNRTDPGPACGGPGGDARLPPFPAVCRASPGKVSTSWRHEFMRLLAAPAAAALVVVLLTPAPSVAQHGGGGPGGAPRPAPARMSAGTPLPRSSSLTASLPDTTLARVFFARGHSDIRVSRAQRAALQAGRAPRLAYPAGDPRGPRTSGPAGHPDPPGAGRAAALDRRRQRRLPAAGGPAHADRGPGLGDRGAGLRHRRPRRHRARQRGPLASWCGIPRWPSLLRCTTRTCSQD